MNTDTRRLLLKIVLLATAAFLIFLLPFMFDLWPGGFRWSHPAAHPAYERMIIAVYFALGVCLIPTALDPERHIMLIDFTILSSLLHGAVMTYDSFAQEHEMTHLVGDVPIIFALAGLLIWLHPRWPRQSVPVDDLPESMNEVELVFRSELRAPKDRVWAWVTSVDGISRELWPLLRMTAPRSVRDLRDVTIEPGRRLFRSWVLLFGVLPIDRSDLTLLRFEEGSGFVEQSPLLSMRLWRHERTLGTNGTRTTLTDKLTFRPRFATPLTKWFIQTVFRHRHRVLQREFGVALERLD